MDTHRATIGKELTADALVKLIGGSNYRVAQFRKDHLAARLLERQAPAQGAVRTVLERAASEALQALSVEAIRAGEQVAEEARRDADQRVAAVERLRDHARQAEADAVLERERALARGAALQEDLERREVARNECSGNSTRYALRFRQSAKPQRCAGPSATVRSPHAMAPSDGRRTRTKERSVSTRRGSGSRRTWQ